MVKIKQHYCSVTKSFGVVSANKKVSGQILFFENFPEQIITAVWKQFHIDDLELPARLLNPQQVSAETEALAWNLFSPQTPLEDFPLVLSAVLQLMWLFVTFLWLPKSARCLHRPRRPLLVSLCGIRALAIACTSTKRKGKSWLHSGQKGISTLDIHWSFHLSMAMS